MEILVLMTAVVSLSTALVNLVIAIKSTKGANSNTSKEKDHRKPPAHDSQSKE